MRSEAAPPAADPCGRWDAELYLPGRRRQTNEAVRVAFDYDKGDFTEFPANWVIFTISWSRASRIARIANRRGLAVYNPPKR